MTNELNASEDTNSEENNTIDEQKTISTNKFIFLSIVSLNLYTLWWFYKEWRFYQQKESLDILPACRALFAIFFLTSLFNKNLNFAKEKGYEKTYSTTLLFIGFLFTSLLAYLDFPYSLVSVLSCVFLIPPLEALNYAKQNSVELNVTEESKFSGRQIVVSIL